MNCLTLGDDVSRQVQTSEIALPGIFTGLLQANTNGCQSNFSVQKLNSSADARHTMMWFECNTYAYSKYEA